MTFSQLHIMMTKVILMFYLVHSSAVLAELRDPTTPFDFYSKSTDRIQSNRNLDRPSRNKAINLSVIYISDNKSIAVINGKEYRENDRFQTYTIQEIQFNKVALSSPKGLKWISLYSDKKSGFSLK